MKIQIDFEGLNRIFCKLGLHRWYYDKGYARANLWKEAKYCLDCGLEKVKK